MRALLFAAAAGLALSGCQTRSIDNAIQTNLPKTCDALNVAHTAFVAATASGKIPQKTSDKEAAAYAGIQTICADPQHTTAASALVLAAEAFAVVSTALQEAKAAQ
jgi:hypothetical protein